MFQTNSYTFFQSQIYFLILWSRNRKNIDILAKNLFRFFTKINSFKNLNKNFNLPGYV